MSDVDPPLSSVHVLFALIGAALYAVAGFLSLASLLVVPAWVVVVLMVVWLASGAYAAARWRNRMFAPLLAGLASMAAWVAAVGVGDRALELWG